VSDLTLYPADLAALSVSQLAALPPEQKAEISRNLDEALAWLKQARAKFDAALDLAYGEQIREARQQAGKDFGVVHLNDGPLHVTVDVPKRVSWDQAQLAAIARRIAAGGDRVSARFMHRDFFTFTPQLKPVIVGNHKPAIRNVDEAMKRRLHLIPFTVTIPPERRDGQLTEKLLAERDGILAWAVQGCLAWQREGLNPPPIVQAATEEYFGAEDALGRWLQERCVREANAKSLTAEPFSDWKQWAESAGEFVGSQRRFSDLLITRGLEKWRNAAGVRGFRGGVGLKHPPKPAYTPYADD
jgi:phage/plasmid-associated DNA primase